MRTTISIAALIIVVGLLVLVIKWDPDHFFSAQPAPISQPLKAIVSSTPKPNEPYIGMAKDDFLQICGDATPTNTVETANVHRSFYVRDQTQNRCFGTFVFDNGVLASISR